MGVGNSTFCRAWRLRGQLLELTFTRDLPKGHTPLSPAASLFDFDAWWRDRAQRRVLLEIYAGLMSVHGVASPERIRARIEEALHARQLVAFRTAPRRVAVSARAEEPVPLVAPTTDGERETWFALKVTDEIGDPVDGLDLTFTFHGEKKTVPTDGAGVARVAGVKGSFASAVVASMASLREKLRPRWKRPRKPAPPTGPKVVTRELEGDLGAVSLENEVPATLVVTPFFKCSEIPGAHFDYGRSFVRADALQPLAEIAEELHETIERKAMLFGHTDLSGGEALNKELGERRARAVLALLTHDADALEELFSGTKDGPHWQEAWGVLEAQYMLNALRVTDDAGNPIKESGVRDAPTQQAIKRFRAGDYLDRPAEQVILAPSIYLGLDGRRELFLAYAKRITRKPVDKERFAKVNGASFVGCGVYNPLSLAAKDRESRRVVVFVFDPASEPQDLPCALRSIKPCQAQLDPPAKAADGKSPYRCKVYKEIAQKCPCNGGADLSHDLVLKFPVPLREADPLPHEYILESEDGTITQKRKLATDARANDAGRAEVAFSHLPHTHAYRLRCIEDGAPYTVIDYAKLPDMQKRAEPPDASLDDGAGELHARFVTAKPIAEEEVASA